MNEVTIAGVIICARPHARFLKSLLRNLELMSPRFDELILIASGFSRLQKLRINRNLKKTSLDVHIQFAPAGSAGTNRNLGWKIADSNLVSFLDADDGYHIYRNKWIKETFSQRPFDLYLHSYEVWSSPKKLELLDSELGSDSRILFGNRELIVNTFAGEDGTPRNRDREMRVAEVITNIALPSSDGSQPFGIHHGHATVRNSIRNQFAFHELGNVRNEDGVFARDVLESGRTVLVDSTILSTYRTGSSALSRDLRPYVLFEKLRKRVLHYWKESRG